MFLKNHNIGIRKQGYACHRKLYDTLNLLYRYGKSFTASSISMLHRSINLFYRYGKKVSPCTTPCTIHHTPCINLLYRYGKRNNDVCFCCCICNCEYQSLIQVWKVKEAEVVDEWAFNVSISYIGMERALRYCKSNRRLVSISYIGMESTTVTQLFKAKKTSINLLYRYGKNNILCSNILYYTIYRLSRIILHDRDEIY